MSTFFQPDSPPQFNNEQFSQFAHIHSHKALDQFKHILRNYLLFNGLFIIIFFVELVASLASLVYAPRSFYTALPIALMLFTIFSYWIINQYVVEKKTYRAATIRKEFFANLKKMITLDINPLEYHMNVANGTFQLTTLLYQKQAFALHLPPFHFNKSWATELIYYLNWKDILTMQELLMGAVIKEHIALIKQDPTNVAIHTSLANTFIALSKIYTPPQYVNIDPSSSLMTRIFNKQ